MADNTTRTITIKINGADALVDLNEIKKALKETGEESKKIKETNLGNFAQNLRALKDQFVAGEIGAKGLAQGVLGVGKAMITAFITNPVGIAIAAIGAAVLVLYNVFKDFKPLVDKIEQSFAALGAVWTVLKSTALALFTGNKNLTESFKGLGASMKDAAIQAAALKKMEQDLEETGAALEVQNAKTKTQIDELLLQSKSRGRTEMERMALIQQAMDLETQQHNLNMKQANDELELSFQKMIQGKKLTVEEIANLKRGGIEAAYALQNKKLLNDAEINSWKDKLIKIEGLNQASTALQEKAQNRLEQLALAAQQKAEAAEAKRLAAAEKKKAADEKMESDYLASLSKQDAKKKEGIATDKAILESENQRYIKEREFFDSRVSSLDAENAKLKEATSVREAFSAALDLKNVDETRPALIGILNSWRGELVKFDTFKTILDKNQLEKEKETALIAFNLKRDLLIKESTDMTASENERKLSYDKLLSLESDYVLRLQEFEDRATEIKSNNLKENALNQIADNDKAIADLTKTYKERMFIVAQSLDLIHNEEVKQVLSEQELYNKRREYEIELDKLKTEKRDKQLQDAADLVNTLGQIDAEATQTAINLQGQKLKNGKITQEQYDKEVAKIQEKAAKREKAYAVAAAIINTAQGISKALASSPPPMSFILAAAVGALGAAQIAKILSTPVKTDSGTAGGGIGSSASSSLSSSSTGTSPNTSFTFEKNTQAVANNPIKTYVLSKDVSTQAQMDRQVIANGSI